MKHHRATLIGFAFVGLLVATTGTVAVTAVVANGSIKTSDAEAVKDPCAGGKQGAVHHVIIEHDKIAPSITTGKLCDLLIITNRDAKPREMAFGQHDHHVPYDGISEQNLAQGKSLTVTLNKAGNFVFHDHLQDEVKGSLAVKP